MKPTFFKGAVAGGIAGALCAAATVALAGTGINGIFNLGVDNSVDGQTLLHGNTGSNPQLRVNNQQGTDAAIGVLGAHSAAAGAGAGAQGDSASTAANASGVFGRITSANAATSSNGVRGINNGAGRGVYGQGASGPGVYGNSTGNYGVWGIGTYGVVGGGSQGGVWASTGNGAGSGVYGQNTGVGGTGVRGFGGNGGWFSSSAANGTGVLGTVNGPGYGVRGEAEVNGSGVRGIGGNGGSFSSVVGNGTGVVGTVTGAGHGVRGEAGANGIGVIGKLSGAGTGVHGLAGPGGVGVRGIGGKTGVYGQATDSTGFAFAANGDAGQSRTGGGWVKAMAVIYPSQPAGQQVVRCYNSQVAPGTPNCGITATGTDVGRWEIDFGFDISDRFLLVTAFHSIRGSWDGIVANAEPWTAGVAEVRLAYNGGESTNSVFYIYVF